MSDVIVNKYSRSDIDGLTSALALKLDAAISFTALATNTTAINKASFAGKAGVQITFNDGNNKTFTFNDDMKDGRVHYINAINAHASTTILLIYSNMPHIEVNDRVPVLAQTQIQISVFWDSLQEAWDINPSDFRVKRAAV